MRQLLLATCSFVLLSGIASADDPGPKVKNTAPFNNPAARMSSNLSCPTTYTPDQFTANREKVVADTKVCVQGSFGISKDIGLDFGSDDPYLDCVVPSTYDARPPANNPIWPVCCPSIDAKGNYRISCRLYFVPNT